MITIIHVLRTASIIFAGRTETSLEVLQRRLLFFAVSDLLLLSVIGVLLRFYSLFPLAIFDYKNLLHAHSHFAFGGWVMPILLVAILKYFPEISRRIPYRNLRNLSIAIIISAYGMLLSFPFQGYGPVSIGFSTLSIFAGLYMTIELWKAARGFNTISVLFLKAGLAFLTISVIGPFATGPLAAMGKAGTSLYYNAVYFYLHFQYNGWFSFVLLAVLYKMLEQIRPPVHGKPAWLLFTIACIPAYFLSTLWSRPHVAFYFISMIATLLQLVAVFYFIKDIRKLALKNNLVDMLFKAAILFFVIKNIVQAISAIPSIAGLVHSHRNFTIAYLHMVLIGFISLGVLASVLKGNESRIKPIVIPGFFLFIIAFILTELLLVLHAAGIVLQVQHLGSQHWLLAISVLFPVAIFLILLGCRKLL